MGMVKQCLRDGSDSKYIICLHSFSNVLLFILCIVFAYAPRFFSFHIFRTARFIQTLNFELLGHSHNKSSPPLQHDTAQELQFCLKSLRSIISVFFYEAQ
jgi:hypothetical protein